MPVEITLPLTKLEQAVADARDNERVMAAKVEDLKLQLKTAKAAWEESVEEMKAAVDEMIRDKRQPSLPFDEAAGDDEADAGAGDPGNGPDGPAPTSPAGQPDGTPTVTVTEVEILTPLPAIETAPFPELAALPAARSVAGASAWRDLIVAEAIDADPSVFDTLAVFGVETMGQLADALLDGKTFNLPLVKVHDLWELIEDVSADDPEPIKFYRGKDAPDVPVTVKEQGESGDGDSGSGDADEEKEPTDLFTSAPEPAAQPVPAEPAKPAKKPRGRKKKEQASEPATQPEAETAAVMPDPEPAAVVDDNPFADL